MINKITKKSFSKLIDGEVILITPDNYITLGVESQYMDFLNAEKITERLWRNKELNGTDWMLVHDATYAGKPLAGSPELEDIKVYRQALRAYNLTTDDRPERPQWFTGI